MAEGNYFSGVGGKVTFTPDSTAVEITVNNTEWTKDESNRVSEVTNAQSGGNAKWIPSVDEQDGSFPVVWDADNPPLSVGLYAGSTGLLKEYLGDSGEFFSQEIVISKVSHKVTTQSGAIMYTVTYKGNGVVTLN